ncbi:eukaryotic translation initiation factor 3 subunit A [Malassezia vespertilionis]|uniref:Eukaryotic translation initiation factor 3 subunit A n=1 Tax=Malassezia vespertilionis TaxID=2020962 RepID=A0A2N1JD24_9BASI|nr:eukaryotic translation initiation factor 3 subunit A [Malassezia vespertilionis]PKI84434.1 Tif32p [Malassezia vespertilionis]WFD06567.1 eukaryotic translation initiation factor 3 subunit A [Malassezia vespertilionis]
MPPVIKPEAVLKRSEELINVGQAGAALQALHEFTFSRRFKQGPSSSLEPLMERFMELCVDQRRGRAAKDALVQYKNAFQNTDSQSIWNVINHFIKLADAKVSEARSRADAAAEELDVDDLEESETPESILLGSVSQDQERDRTDRTLVTPWLKFLWEAYRTALDILKNNTRLETAYEQISDQALRFCLLYQRKSEFRRLCEVLRQHLQSVARSAHHTNAIDFSDPETLQRHLDTRFTQLTIAVELELWQEAFRSVEDVHNLLTIAKKAPKPAMMANYYEKLTRIFIVSDNHLFHAAAWNRYYALARLTAHSEEEQARMASFVLLSALAVPVIASTAPGTGNLNKGRTDFLQTDSETRQRTGRLNALLGLGRTPTRAGLLREALNRNVLRRVHPELRNLYHILEVEFHPLSICAKIEPILRQVAQDPDMAKYVKPLHSVVLTRLLQQLSQVYDSVKLQQVMELVGAFKAPYHYGAADIEKFCLNACKRGHLNLRIDHVSQAITFQDDVFAADVHPAVSGAGDKDLVRLQATPSELVRTQLARLAENLDTTLRVVDKDTLGAAQDIRNAAFGRAIAEADKEHQLAMDRKVKLERRKELLREMAKKKEEEEAVAKAERLREQAEAEQRRFAEEARRRELEHVRKEMEAAKLEEARKMAQSLKEKGGLKLSEEEFASLDTEKLVQLQVEQIEREKRELSDKLRTVQRRMDHIERAYRREEQPLLAADYERQQKVDLENHKLAREGLLVAARERFERDMAMKKLLMNVAPDYENMKNMLLGKRCALYDEQCAQAQNEIEKEKEQRRAVHIRMREEEEKRREEEEEERKHFAEEEERMAQEQERMAEQARADAQHRAELDARKHAEVEERENLLRQQAEKQAAQQAKAQERLDRERHASTQQPDGGVWRRGGAAAPTSGASDPMFANRRYRPGDLSRNTEPRTMEPRAMEPRAPSKPSESSGRYVPGTFSRMRQSAGGNAPDAPARTAAEPPAKNDDGFTPVKPRNSGAYRPPSAR